MPVGRMLEVSRDEVLAALDCARCRSLVEAHAPATMDLYGPRRVDVGTGVAYAVAACFGRSDDPSPACPDCSRRLDIQEGRNFYWTFMPLDRDVVGR